MRPSVDDEVDAHLRRARIKLRAAIAVLGRIGDRDGAIKRSTDRLALLVERPGAAVAEDAHDESRHRLAIAIEHESSGRDGQIASERSMQEIA